MNAGDGVRGNPRTRVLYVEPSAEQRARLRSILQASGLELEEASDAREALAQADRMPPDLVLLDGQLPEARSGGLVHQLRTSSVLQRVPLIMHGSAADREALGNGGCDGFLDEPLDEARLAEQLRSFVGRDAAFEQSRVESLQREVASASGEVNRLREQARIRSEFMRNLAHELATPLTPLVGYLKLLRSGRLGELNERQQQVLAAMTHAAERLEHSIDNLVDYAALETGKYRVIAAEFDASALVDHGVQDLYVKARSKHVRIEVRKPEHVMLVGDERKLRQALTNVLENALRASPNGGIVLVELKDSPERVTFAVYDQGPGIPPDVRRVVESGALLRADERAGSAGLGLPVTKQIVTAHGGELLLESPPREQPDIRNLFSGGRVGFSIPRPAAPSP